LPRAACLLLLAAVAVTAVAAADGAFPGRNGRIVFDSGEGAFLLTVRADGSGESVVPRRGGLGSREAFDPAYSPDGRQLAFVSGSAGSGRPFAVYAMNLDGTRARRVLVGATAPAWSPDGSRLVVVRGRDLHIVRADGSHRRRLNPGGVVPRRASWSPDGRRILFVGFSRAKHDFCCLYAVRPSGKGLRRILAEPRGKAVFQAIWSPDGRRLAFTEVDGCREDAVCGGPAHVFTATPEGTERRLLVDEAALGAWSPDGRYVLYQGDEQPGIYVLDLASREAARIREREDGHVGFDWQPRCTRAGTDGDDRLGGGRSADLVCGLGGADMIIGGRGRDGLFGEDGNDRIDARDGAFDVVGCGAGRDTALVDRRDLVGVDCERVARR
jgi:Tol biopolymer transport system component